MAEPRRRPSDPNADALERAYRREAPRLQRFFARHTFDSDASADLVAETFARASEQQGRSFRGVSDEVVAKRLDRLARAALASFYRDGRTRRVLPVDPADLPVASAEDEGIERIAADTGMESRVAEGVAALPERQKLIIALHIYEGMPFSEIAAVLGVAQPTARTLYARALRALAGRLTVERDAGEPQTTLLGPHGEPLAADAPERRELDVRVAAISEELIAYLAGHPELLYQLAPRKFEELVAELYARRGFDVTLTPPTGDGGVDVYVARHDELGTSLSVVQCKRYAARHKVGVALVRELQGTILATGASAGILLTTSFFTAGARAVEKRFQYQLSLQDYFALRRLLELPRLHG